MALCPICEHPLPETPIGRCPNCGAEIVAQSALAPVTPAPGPDAMPRPEATPWDDRARIGFVAALIETTRQVLSGPSAFFRDLPVTGGIGSPLLYGVVLGWGGAVAAGFYSALFHSIVGTSLVDALSRLVNPNAAPTASPFAGFLEGWGGLIVQLLFGGFFAAVGIVIYAGILHLALLLLSGAQRGFEATLRVVAFSQAVSVVFLLPFCGQLAGAVWGLILYVIGVAEVHRIGYGKAIAAVLLPLVVVCCCCGALLALVFVGAAGLASQIR